MQDPEHETHHKIFIGYYFDKVTIGFDLHIFINEDIYFDQQLSFFPQNMLDDDWENAFLYDTTIQVGSIGYKRVWVSTEDTTYLNLFFVETLEIIK